LIYSIPFDRLSKDRFKTLRDDFVKLWRIEPQFVNRKISPSRAIAFNFPVPCPLKLNSRR
jgi:hypothetical protein